MKSILGLLTLLTLSVAAMHPSDFVVHEWGTFTSVAGENGAAVDWDALGCKNDLPRFVNDFGYRGFKWRLQGTVRMETPVLYFYSDRELDARVKVGFPQGLITEWYPKADYQIFQNRGEGSMRQLPANLQGIDTTLRTLTGAIEWKDIKVQPGATPSLAVESEASRYYAARATDSTPLTAGGQAEKFLFYRGVGRFPVPITGRLTANDKVVVEDHTADGIPTAILFENRGGRIGYRLSSKIARTETLDAPALNSSMSDLKQDLVSALVTQGLYPKEAQAMVATWQDSWFEEGSRLIYLLPQSAVDSILPLQVTPAPSRTVRVFVGRIELFTPATLHTVESAVARADYATVARYGRFVAPILQRLYPGDQHRIGEIEARYGDSKVGSCR